MALSSQFGTSSPDGKTSPGAKRAERLAAQAATLAAKTPTQASVEMMERAVAPSERPSHAPTPSTNVPGAFGAPVRAAHKHAGTAPSSDVGPTPAGPIEMRPVDAVRPSPFQPKGRPSVVAIEAVRAAITAAGSLEALVGRTGTPLFARLDAEAARLAELAYSIAENGIETPLEVRIAEDGAEECLSGHRRLAAARLAGRTEIPVLSRGALSSAQAAAKVLTGNLHRESFTAWQEAVLVNQVQERRRADGLAADVRALGSVMGWSTGKVHQLLRARQVFSPSVLAAIGAGDAARVEDGLARLQRAELKRLSEAPDEAARVESVRRVLGFAATAPSSGAAPQRAVCTHRPKRGGGFVVEVDEAVESLNAGDATLVYEVLSTQLARVRARLAQLGRPTA